MQRDIVVEDGFRQRTIVRQQHGTAPLDDPTAGSDQSSRNPGLAQFAEHSGSSTIFRHRTLGDDFRVPMGRSLARIPFRQVHLDPGVDETWINCLAFQIERSQSCRNRQIGSDRDDFSVGDPYLALLDDLTRRRHDRRPSDQVVFDGMILYADIWFGIDPLGQRQCGHQSQAHC